MSKNQKKVAKQQFGTVVRQLRKQRGMKQKDLAEKLSITMAAMSRIETGEVHISLTRMLSIINALGLANFTVSKTGGGTAHITFQEKASGCPACFIKTGAVWPPYYENEI
tara:strand:+ start:186 stop:515 length:330 start_codon:yes stop_codon:yes gene_type:complete